jgi:NAD(P)-dependent dehydrogenase (short-subunit alcohol dehydrogenase family)
MEVNSILVTGSNRGLGLEWVRQYAELGWRVYATCRFPEQADELQQLANDYSNMSVHRLDVTNAEQIKQLSAEIRDTAIDVLINNAGVYFERWSKDPPGSINYTDWQQTYSVNVLGAMRVSEALLQQVGRSERRLLVAISSHMGSIADINSGRDFAYRSSKAALNAAMKGLACELAPRNIGVLLLHPGWVKTRMGGESALYTPTESVLGMRELIDKFTPDQSGTFLRFDGVQMPW